MKATFCRALSAEDGSIELTLSTHDKSEINAVRELGIQTMLEVEIKKFRERRSQNANSYFHVLCDKIAKVQGLGIDEVKKALVCDYGTVAMIARIPADADLSEIYPYNKYIGESEGTKKPCSDYYIFKPTHTLNTEEMARLIDGAVQEAQNLGIETKTPEQINDLLSLMEVKNEQRRIR